MKSKSTLKEIPIDKLVPGMFVVEMDVPWYRTPFLFHRRLIHDAEMVRVMKRCGITTVTIDISRGGDIEPTNRLEAPSEAASETPPTGMAGETPGAAPTGAACRSAPGAGRLSGGGGLDQPGPNEETAQKGGERPGRADAEAAPGSAARRIYLDAQEAVERIFADLEQGIPPPPQTVKALVMNFIAHVLDHRAGLVTQVALEKLRQFDHSLSAHGLTTSILSLIVGMEAGMEGTDLEYLGTAGLIHDAGYVRLPRNLVRRRWECSEDERRLLEQHVTFGAALLGEHGQLPETVIRIIEQHHERGDGSGYPAKASGEEILQGAKILGLIDVYDAMISRRSGRPAMLPHHAIRQLFLAGERGEFDKALVELAIRSIGVYPIGSLVRLNTGEQAVVVGINPQQRLKPRVKITGGPQGESYTTPVELDLAAQPADRHVKSVVRVLDPVQERVSVAMYLDDERAA